MISAEDFYFKEPLYRSFEYTEIDFENLFKLIYYSGKIDNFCPFCKKDTIFKANPLYLKASKQTGSYSFSPDLLTNFEGFSAEKEINHFRNSVFEISFNCERDQYNHVCKFYTKFETLDYTKTIFQKIGQHPSFADLNDYKTKKFNKVLNNEKFHELNKGIGLASHGVGIGSFVYFRRIFEDLVFETYENHRETIGEEFNEDKFKRLKMNDKIEMLKPFLPTFIYENRNLYGLMSKGIHQLSDIECLDKYKTVELGIRLILEDKLIEYQKKEMVDEFNRHKNKT